MSEKYLEFRLMDLPPNEFSVLLEPKLQKRLIKETINNFVQEKKEKLKEILATYKRYTFRLNEGLTNVLKLLQENVGLTAYQIAQKLNKHKDTAFFHINRGIKRGFISKNSQKMPFTYFLTSNGKEFLKKVGE